MVLRCLLSDVPNGITSCYCREMLNSYIVGCDSKLYCRVCPFMIILFFSLLISFPCST